MIGLDASRFFVEKSGYSLNDFPKLYDAFRPNPPSTITAILTQIAETEKPRLVVDLGSGTGLSTRIWAGRAEKIIGIEPNPYMRNYAQTQTANLPNGEQIRYQDGLSSQTGLHDNCADIVTCAQSLHWMEPKATFTEVARILRPGGVFAAYDYTWPPIIKWGIDIAYQTFITRFNEAIKKHRFYPGIKMWPKNDHLKRMEESGLFRFAREIFFHNIGSGDADRLVGLVRSRGPIFTLINQKKLSAEEIGLTEYKNAVQTILGTRSYPWYISYRMWVGIK